MTRDVHAVGGDNEGGKPKIRLFTASGQLLATLQVSTAGPLGKVVQYGLHAVSVSLLIVALCSFALLLCSGISVPSSA
jgi:hypothetical protein